MSVVDTVEILKGRDLTNDEYFKAAVLGWCIELVRSDFQLFYVPEVLVIKKRALVRFARPSMLRVPMKDVLRVFTALA